MINVDLFDSVITAEDVQKKLNESLEAPVKEEEQEAVCPECGESPCKCESCSKELAEEAEEVAEEEVEAVPEEVIAEEELVDDVEAAVEDAAGEECCDDIKERLEKLLAEVEAIKALLAEKE